MSGNRLQLLDAAEPILRSMISDIDHVKRFWLNLKACIYPGLFAISLIAMAGTKSPKMKLTTMLSEPFPFR